MNQLIKIAWLGILGTVFFAVSLYAGELPNLKGRKVIAVTENAYIPLNFVDPDTGKGIGWEYDAFNEIARRLNLKVEWKLSSWDAMITAVRNAQFDIGMDGISITDERKKQVDFSDSYLVSQQFMLVRKKENRFSNAAEFKKNKKLLAGAQGGTTGFYVTVYNVLDGNEQNKRIKIFETFGVIVQALKSGDVDMVLMDAVSSRGYIGANPNSFKNVGKALGTDNFGFIFTPKSDLVEPVNQALAEMKKDGFIEGLNKKWFFDYKNQ